MQPSQPSPGQQPSEPYLPQQPQTWGYGPSPQPTRAPRWFTIGIAVQLFGIAVAIFGLAAGSLYFAGTGIAYQPNLALAGLGVFFALAGLAMHAARI